MENFDYNQVGWETEDKSAVKDNHKDKYNDSDLNLDVDTQLSSTLEPTGSVEVDPMNKGLNIRPASMTISISLPKREGEGSSDMHISYLVTTQTEMAGFSSEGTSLRRRFQDFVNLHFILQTDLPANVIPPLPEKHRMEYLTGDRFSEDFIEKRRVSLERFMNRIAIHPTLQQTQVFQSFLTDTDWSIKAYDQVFAESGVLESLSDSIVNAFSKLKTQPHKFELIRTQLDRLEKDLVTVDKIHQKIIKRKTDWGADYTDLALHLTQLGLLETNLTSTLNAFCRTLNTFSNHIQDTNKLEDIYYLSHLREYIAYCHKVKNVLKLRDQRQVDFEELTDYLALQVTELQKIQANGRPSGLSSFLKDKLENIKGTDQELLKSDRIHKCELKIVELEDAVRTSDQVHLAFSQEVEKEFQIFQQSKTVDLKDALVTYAKSQVLFFKQSMELWQDLLPKLQVDAQHTRHTVLGVLSDVGADLHKHLDLEPHHHLDLTVQAPGEGVPIQDDNGLYDTTPW